MNNLEDGNFRHHESTAGKTVQHQRGLGQAYWEVLSPDVDESLLVKNLRLVSVSSSNVAAGHE